jgi:hypothetical protein
VSLAVDRAFTFVIIFCTFAALLCRHHQRAAHQAGSAGRRSPVDPLEVMPDALRFVHRHDPGI